MTSKAAWKRHKAEIYQLYYQGMEPEELAKRFKTTYCGVLKAIRAGWALSGARPSRRSRPEGIQPSSEKIV